MEPSDRLIVALDRSDRTEILNLVEALSGIVSTFKIGLQAFISHGPGLVREIEQRGAGIFLDLKLHDIPNTVGEATRAAATVGVRMLTIHAAGGPEMMKASAAAIAGTNVVLLAVTVLTSLSERDLAAMGWRRGVAETVEQLALSARESGLGGVVCSPMEIASLRQRLGNSMVIVTPGIRGATDRADDQKRTMAAAEAIRAGADYLVVGRPVTTAADPAEAARRLVDEIANAS